MQLNPLCVEFRPQLMDHIAVPLKRQQPTLQPPPLTPTERKAWRIRALAALDANGQSVAASVHVRNDGKPHHFLTAESKVTRADRTSITRWQLGMVASHQVCKTCGGVLSRVHAVACAGVLVELMGLVGRILPKDRVGCTEIDWVINSAAKLMTPECAEAIVRAIDAVERKCRGRERTEQGFWQ